MTRQALHRLSNIDDSAGVGDCAVCGVGVSLSRSRDRSNGWRCRAARNQRRHGTWRPDLYAHILARQGGGCAICGAEPEGFPLAIDHDHACCKRGCPKCVRGLLCIGCNTGLGKLGDSIDGLRRAIRYLESAGR